MGSKYNGDKCEGAAERLEKWGEEEEEEEDSDTKDKARDVQKKPKNERSRTEVWCRRAAGGRGGDQSR